MVLCTAATVLFAILWVACRKKLSHRTKKMIGIAAASALLGIIVGLGERNQIGLAEGKYLKRNAAGEGSYTQDLKVTAEGIFEDYPYSVVVEEQILTLEEEEAYLQAAVLEMEQEFLGENPSFDEIRGPIQVRKTYQNGFVDAKWNFDPDEIIDSNGNITEIQLPEQGMAVTAEVELTCGDSVRKTEIRLRVFGRKVSTQEKILAGLQKEIQKRMGQGDILELPDTVEGYAVSWKEEKSYLPERVFFLGCLLVLLVPLSERSRERENMQMRQSLLVLEYPELVSKLAVLLGGGMTPFRAFQKIAFVYEEKRKRRKIKELPVYEEMLVTCREMENGVGEARAYLHFGERCNLPEYRRLAKLLGQTLKKGGHEMTDLLMEEAEDALEKRKVMARRLGEEAGTKLLFPMIIMLGMIMVILMVPAMYTLNI